jgi:signal peptidase I
MLQTIQRAVAIVFITLLILVSAGLLALRINHGNVLSVQSESMVPSLNKGDLVTVAHVPVSDLKIGDVITYTSPKDSQVTITHRLVGTPAELGINSFETKGDANQTTDPLITPAAIIGRTVYAIPKLGYVADFLRQPLGLLVLIYLPALFILGSEIRRLIRRYQAQEEYMMSGYDNTHQPRPYRHVHLVR